MLIYPISENYAMNENTAMNENSAMNVNSTMNENSSNASNHTNPLPTAIQILGDRDIMELHKEKRRETNGPYCSCG
jgi:hypothetical protein